MSRPIGISPTFVTATLSALFVVLWSAGFVGVRLASDSAPAATTLLWRSVVLTLALSPWLVRALRRLGRSELLREALVGLLSQAVYLIAVYVAIERGVSSGTTALMDGIQPLVVAVLAGPLLGVVVLARHWLGLGLGLLGVALVSAGDLLAPDTTAPLWAYPVPLLGMAGLVAATFVDRTRPRRARPMEALAVHCTVTMLVSGVLAGATGRAAPPTTLDFWFAVAWLAVLATLGGYGLYWLLLERHGVTHVNTLLFLVPPVTTVWGAVWFGEPLGALTVTGLAVALVAVRLAGGAAPRDDDRAAVRPERRSTCQTAA